MACWPLKEPAACRRVHAAHPPAPMDSPARAAAALLDRERALLGRLARLLDATDADAETRRRVADLAAGLDSLFLLVVAGEFNAGKSTLVNALFGRRVMEEGPVPTTDKITVLRHGDADETHRRGDFVTERRIDHPLLESLALVDTPGTNSIVREHQALTEDFVPRADLVLFVTSYDRPLSESERQFLLYIQGAWRKRLVVAINKADQAATEEALQQVVGHVRDGLRGVMRDALAASELPAGESIPDPLIFPVAARLALAAREAHRGPDGQPDEAAVRADPRWEASRMGPLERFLTETLTEGARLALKLAAPLDAAGALLGETRSRLGAATATLAADDARLADLRDRVGAVRADLATVTDGAVADVDRALLEMEKRGARFLDDTIRVSRLSLLRDRNAFREEFQRQVVRDAEAQIETRLGEAADGVLRKVYELWNETYTRLSAFQPPDATFVYGRDEVLRDVLREAKRTVETYDLDEEARRLLENARSAVTVGGLGAAGLGAAAIALIAATAFDVTGGLIAAGAVASLAFIVLPAQRRRAVREFSERVDALRTDLRDKLGATFAREADAAISRVRRLVEPVETLVAGARARHEASAAEAEAVAADLAALRAEVEAQVGRSGV